VPDAAALLKSLQDKLKLPGTPGGSAAGAGDPGSADAGLLTLLLGGLGG
jgi:hypothetical protein